MIKKLAAVLAIIVGITNIGGIFAPESAYAAAAPEIIAEAGILIDGTTGQILYTKNENATLEPASTTKMITCLLAIENLEMDNVVTIDDETPFTEGSRIYLLEDEQITVENLLYALMLESANDAAVALAKEISGSTEAFAVKMNERAKELGATSTNFVNPNGLHTEGHLSTVHDLAMIAKGCMENETFRTLCSTYYHYIPATNKQDERHMYNTNRLLYDEKTLVPVNGVSVPAKYEGAVGIKTGYTSHAGGCLVAGAERDGTFLIAVVMKSTDAGRFGDSIALFDYGFASYHTVKAADITDDMGRASVKRGAVADVGLELAESAYVTLPIEASSSVLSTKLVLEDERTAPIKKGDELGRLEIYEGESNLLTTVSVLAKEEVGEGTLLSVFGIENHTAYIIYIVAGVIVTLMLALTIAYIVLKRRQIRRRRERRAKRAMEIAKQRLEREKDITKRDWRF